MGDNSKNRGDKKGDNLSVVAGWICDAYAFDGTDRVSRLKIGETKRETAFRRLPVGYATHMSLAVPPGVSHSKIGETKRETTFQRLPVGYAAHMSLMVPPGVSHSIIGETKRETTFQRSPSGYAMRMCLMVPPGVSRSKKQGDKKRDSFSHLFIEYAMCMQSIAPVKCRYRKAGDKYWNSGLSRFFRARFACSALPTAPLCFGPLADLLLPAMPILTKPPDLFL